MSYVEVTGGFVRMYNKNKDEFIKNIEKKYPYANISPIDQ